MKATQHCTRCDNTPCACAYRRIDERAVRITTEQRLSDADVERIAQRVVELLKNEGP